MSRTNFRIKVDLSKFYQDARRFCWVFVDGTKILQIHHIKQHITRLFNIKEPFHLLLNDTEYLPPTEDVRILKENETVFVIPGSGLENEMEVTNVSTLVLEAQNDTSKQERANNSVHHKEAQTMDISVTKTEPTVSHQQDMSNDTIGERKQDVSTVDLTFHSIMEETEADSATESKTTDSNLAEELSVMDKTASVAKRKRVRRRKPKKLMSFHLESINDEESQPKKPKIIDSLIIPSGKHIRFDTIESENSTPIKTSQDIKNGDPPAKAFSSENLSTLLALRQSSTPLTFVNKRVKDEIKIENDSDEETRNNQISNSINKNVTFSNLNESICKTEINGETLRNANTLTIDIKACPVMTAKPQTNDIIAFKMLKIGPDYTPQVSEFIIGEVLSSCPKSTVYVFKILKGVDQVQVPIGKFTLPNEKSEDAVNDTITLNYSQIIEPRFICKSRGDKTILPVLVNI